MLNGKGNAAEIEQRCDQIKSHFDQATSDYEKEKLNER